MTRISPGLLFAFITAAGLIMQPDFTVGEGVQNPPIAPRAVPAPPIPPPGLPARQFNIRVEHKSVNGATEIVVDENDTHVEIAHRDGKKIVVKVARPAQHDLTEPEADVFEGKDAADLKDKHPEAYDWFEKYGTPGRHAGNGPRIGPFPGGPPAPVPPFGGRPFPIPQFPAPQFRAPPFPVPQLPGGPRQFGFPGAFPRRPMPNADAAYDELRQLVGHLHELAEKKQIDRDELRKLADQLQKVHERLTDPQTDTDDTP